MGRSPCCSKDEMNRGAWTAIEDKTLSDYIKLHGEGKWRNLPKRAGLRRCGKSCRLRWLNYLRPDIKRGNITIEEEDLIIRLHKLLGNSVSGLKRCGKSCRLRWLNYLWPDIKRGNITIEEEDLIIRLHKLLGNRWSLIAGRLPGRTDNEIKNYWNTSNTRMLKGNPSSASHPNLTKCPSKQSLSPTIQRSRFSPPSGEKESQAIRTKASRCTRILYDHGVDFGSTSYDQDQFHADVAVGQGPLDDGRSPLFDWNDSELSDFLMDLDMDGNFLSDFLNTEIFDTKTSSSSPNSDETLLFPSEFIPFLDSSLDWPQDQ